MTIITRAALASVGFRTMEAHHYLENPLRGYFMAPVRDDFGDFIGIPLMYGLLPDHEMYEEAKRLYAERYRRRHVGLRNYRERKTGCR